MFAPTAFLVRPSSQTIRAGYHANAQSSNIWLALFTGLIKNSISSIIVGVALSLVLARIMKLLGPARHRVGESDAAIYDVSIVMLGGYLSYIVAVSLGLSGIVALFVSGIVHSHYTLYNVGEEASSTLRLVFEPMSMLAESFTFAYMGLQVAIGSLQVQWGLMLSALPLCVISRMANIMPLAALLRVTGAADISWPIQLMQVRDVKRGGSSRVTASHPLAASDAALPLQVFSGTRGSMSYALAVNMPDINANTLDDKAGNPFMGECHACASRPPAPARLFRSSWRPRCAPCPAESSTLFIAIVTTVLVGSLTVPTLRALRLEQDADEAMGDMALSPTSEYRRVRSEDEADVWTAKTVWRNIDSHFMKPFFGGKRETLPIPARAPSLRGRHVMMTEARESSHGNDSLSP